MRERLIFKSISVYILFYGMLSTFSFVHSFEFKNADMRRTSNKERFLDVSYVNVSVLVFLFFLLEYFYVKKEQRSHSLSCTDLLASIFFSLPLIIVPGYLPLTEFLPWSSLL